MRCFLETETTTQKRTKLQKRTKKDKKGKRPRLNPPRLAALEITTTKIIDCKICAFAFLLWWRFPKKSSVFGRISSLALMHLPFAAFEGGYHTSSCLLEGVEIQGGVAATLSPVALQWAT